MDSSGIISENNLTDLRLSGVGVTPFSARGLSQTYQPIDEDAAPVRTVNGDLIDISFSSFKKYKTTITCTDQDVPALDGVWRGKQIVVDCIFELSYLTGTVGSPGRDVVENSSRTSGDFTFYKPRLTCRVMDYNVSTDEWGRDIGWQLDLEEV